MNRYLNLKYFKGFEIIAIEIKDSTSSSSLREFLFSCRKDKATREYILGTVDKNHTIENGTLVCNFNVLIKTLTK